jgi:hypothetical protein
VIPNDRGQSAPVGGMMGSRPCLGVKSGALGGGFSHALALECQPVRVVHEPIEDRIGDSWIGDRLTPVSPKSKQMF